MKIIKYLLIALICFYSCDDDREDNVNESYEDCYGTLDGIAFIDDCGMCASGLTGHVENSDMDCANECGGIKYLNGCGDCVSEDIDTCTVDCNGDAIEEDCTIQTIAGCAIFDECGICSGGNSGYEYNADVDCFSVCFGDAVTDTCDNCGYYTDGECEESCKDCFGICGGSAEYDECGICDGEGIPDGICDCNGNIDTDNDGICDYNDDCEGEYDYCGICNGDGSWDNIECEDECFSETPQSTMDEIDCAPNGFLYTVNQVNPAGYYFHTVTINNIPIDNKDWVGAFNGDVCYGAIEWDPDNCTGDNCLVSVEYMIGTPTFKIYDFSEKKYYFAQPSNNHAWVMGELFIIDNLNATVQ